MTPNRTPALPAMGTVSGYPVLMRARLDEVCDVLLCQRGADRFVVWFWNRPAGGASSGSYHDGPDAFEAAVAYFSEQLQRWVQPPLA